MRTNGHLNILFTWLVAGRCWCLVHRWTALDGESLVLRHATRTLNFITSSRSESIMRLYGAACPTLECWFRTGCIVVLKF